jgi:thiol:disulfide interchange protein DsbA
MKKSKQAEHSSWVKAIKKPGVGQFMSDHRRIINVGLSFWGLIVIALYYFCGSSCLYLAGTVFGIDLKIWGLIYLCVFAVIAILKQEALACVLLSAGLGGEIFLVGYQVIHQTYCPYCLILALIIAVLFVINLDKRKATVTLLSVILGFVFLMTFFQSIPLKINTGGQTLPSFGRGDVKVRLYTDYFCGPCREVEPAAEAVLYDLARKDRINLTFVDMPIHEHTPVYTAYYLSLAQRERGLDRVLQIRKALFRAAEKRIEESRGLRKYLVQEGFDVKNVNEQANSAAIAKYFQEDKVNGTPTLVVVQGKKKMKYFGRVEVLKGLQMLK